MHVLSRSPKTGSAPPAPPRSLYGGGGDGDRHRMPFVLWLCLVVDVVAVGAGFYLFGLGVDRRPIPVLAATLVVGAVGWVQRRRIRHSADFGALRLIAAGIAGGVAGEALHDTVVALPLSGLTGAAWRVVGALGIGGGIGIGVSTLALASLGAVVIARLIRQWPAA